MKPNLQLAELLKDLIAEYNENKKDEVLNKLSRKYRVERDDVEFYLEAVNSYNCHPMLVNMGVTATYDESFMEVFRAMDYLNGKIDEQCRSAKAEKAEGFFSKFWGRLFK